MNTQYQDKLLINDIISRNYYYYFKRGNDKTICFTFFYNHKFNNSSIIPNFSSPVSNFENICNNLQIYLNYYISQKFLCDIRINDEFWLTDDTIKNSIKNIFYDTFSKSDRKPKNIIISFNAIHCIKDKYIWLEELYQDFKNIGINIFYSIDTNLIDITDVNFLYQIQSFLLQPYVKLKIKINPNNLVYFMEIFDAFYNKFKSNLYLYEEDNCNWTEFKINEYIEFLNKYIELLNNECLNNNQNFLNEIFNGELSLISLKDNGVLLDKNSKGQCQFYKSLNILMEDLTINMCPKFQYDDQIIGQYNVDNNSIIDIEPKVFALIMMNTHLKKSSTPHCESCNFVVFCQGFCCRESYKLCFNPIIPIRENCMLKRAKYAFILLKLQHMNILTSENLQKLKLDPYYFNFINSLIKNIIGEF